MKHRHLFIAYTLLIYAFSNLAYLYLSGDYVQIPILLLLSLAFLSGHFIKENEAWAFPLGIICSGLGTLFFGYQVYLSSSSILLGLLGISIVSTLLHFIPKTEK